jgi:flagellar M-ring protein FliF
VGGQLTKALDRLGTPARMMVLAIAVVTIGVVVYLVSSAGPAAYVTAFTNLDPKTAGEIQSTLAGAGIDAQLGPGGESVKVPGAKVDAARVAIAQSDVAVGTAEGWSLFDKSDMSATDTETQVKFQRAMAGELTRTIESIAGIRSATVNLALPKDTVFTDDQRQPTAAVLVDTGTGTLPDETVRGIVRLVAAGVPGLTADNVTITNEQGQLLSSSQAGIGDGAADRLSTEASWNRRMSSKAQAQLDMLLGPGKSTVSVTGELNLDRTTKTTQTFGDNKGNLQAQTEEEKLRQRNTPGGGGAGTGANTPGGAEAVEAESTSNFDHKKSTSTKAIDTEQSTIEIAPGDPEQVSVSLVVSRDALNNVVEGAFDAKNKTAPVDEEKAAQAMATLEDVVKRAVGWRQDRDGTDSFTSAMAAKFDDPVASLEKTGAVLSGSASAGAAEGPLGMVMSYGKQAAAAIGFLLFLFLVRRSLKRRQALLSSTDSAWLPALEAPPISIEELLPGQTGPSEAEVAALKKKRLQGAVEEMATQRPQEVAMALRGWLSAEN